MQRREPGQQHQAERQQRLPQKGRSSTRALSPPEPFGLVVLFLQSPECLSITRRNWGNRAGVGWSRRGAGIALCPTPKCLQTNRTALPAPDAALLCSQGLCSPGQGALALPDRAGAWDGQTRPGHVQGSTAERKVKFSCVWMWIWDFLFPAAAGICVLWSAN